MKRVLGFKSPNVVKTVEPRGQVVLVCLRTGHVLKATTDPGLAVAYALAYSRRFKVDTYLADVPDITSDNKSTGIKKIVEFRVSYNMIVATSDASDTPFREEIPLHAPADPEKEKWF